MMFLSKFGAKIAAFLLIVALVLGSLNYIEKRAETRQMQEQKIELIEKEIEIRKKVDEILQDNRTSNPDRDGAIALERLRQRYRSTSEDN